MNLRLVPLVPLAALALAGCSVETNPDPAPIAVVEPTVPPATAGTLVVHWTIDGRTDPNACVQGVATEIEISVRDVRGSEIGAYRQNCETFSTSIPLTAGSYTATGTLLDGAAQPRTTGVLIDGFTILGNDTLDVAVDFPASSFR